MSSTPPRDPQQLARLTQASLARRRDKIQERQAHSLQTVDRLVRQQREVTTGLQQDLATLHDRGQVLDELEARQQEGGLLAALTRQLTRRRTMLERRSVTEGLIAQYEKVSVGLRRATAFSDELRLCAVDLQAQVDQLHAELARAQQDRARCADKVHAFERQIQALERGEGDALDLSADERQRRLDRLEFDERSTSIDLELHMARARMARQHLDPARKLRDTVLSLQEDMGRFVLAATTTVNSAGRRIQALGMAADAPLVVSELQSSLDELRTAMEATQSYVEQSQSLLSEVLPELSRRLEAQGEVDGEVLSSSLAEMSRERARALADQALKEAADAEVDAIADRTL